MKSRIPLLLALALGLAALTACSARTQASMNVPEDPAQAVTLYRQVLAEQPDSARTRIQLGRALIHDGQYAEARTVLLEAQQKLPDDPQVGFYLALSEMGTSGPGGALTKLMDYHPYDKQYLGETVRLEAQRASVRNLDDAGVIRRMEAAYERGRLLERQREDPMLRKLEEDK